MNQKNQKLEIANRCNGILLYVLAGVLLLAAPDIEANWRVSPELGAGIQYDDNVFLNDVSGLSESDTAYALTALATFFYDTQLTEISITPRLRSTRLRDDSELNSDDQFLDFDFNHDRQKSNFHFRGRYSSESVRTAELSDVDFEIEDPDEIPADDTGRVFATGKRDRVRLSPEFSYALSQRTLLSFDANYQDTSYDDDVSSLFLNGFAEYDIGASLSYAWSEKDTISIGARAGKFEPDRSDIDLASNEFGVGYDRRLSERTLFRLRVGADTSEDQAGDDQTSAVGEMSLIHRYETTRIFATYQRTSSGSGSSRLSLRDAISLNVSRDLSPKLTLSAGVRAYSTGALDSADSDFVERDYLQVRARARWNVSRTVSLDFDYRYTDIARELQGVSVFDGDANQVGIYVNWHPNPL